MKKQYWKEKDGKFLLETEAFALASLYYRSFNKYSRKHIALSKVKESKYWNAFVKTIELRGSQEEWDKGLFIKVLFDEYGQFYPYKLYSDEVWKTYKDYYSRGFEDRDKSIAISLLNAYKEIKAWSKRKGKEEVDMEGYFKNPLNIALLENKRPSTYLLSISKTFKDYYRELHVAGQFAIVKPSELESCRRAVIKNKKIASKMKELLGEEFDGGVI